MDRRSDSPPERRAAAALAGVYAGLARLRRTDDVAALIRLAPAEVCRSLAFERAVLVRVAGDELITASAWPDGAQTLVGTAPNTAQQASAPIVSEGRVVGFLHADRDGYGPAIDELDRVALSVFAEAFACAFERSALRGRLRAQLEHVREVMDTTDQLLDEVIETELQVGIVEQRSSTSITEAAHALAQPAAAIDEDEPSGLTPREVEVIQLIAAGETNARIADRLLISESTVKSHVKHILRKLGASHRAEAVSRHLAATGRR
ncbi:MAG: helix-turn-helix transcriptional regulator [Solirubrobacteraceae bacterium]